MGRDVAVFVGGVHTLFDDVGAVEKQETREFLQRFLQAFAAWIAVHAAP